jgi:hypothetical protein
MSVEASVLRDLPAAALEGASFQWQQFRIAMHVEDPARLPRPEHAHWDWRNKWDSVDAGHHQLVAVTTFVNDRNGWRAEEIQGLMAVERTPRPSVLNPHSGPVVYLDYVETAPWNLKMFTSTPRYAGVGTVLLAEAVRMSSESGFQGRVGLHSLPQAEGFYLRAGMTKIGEDPGYYDLVYFEFLEDAATDFLANTEVMP